MHGVFAAESSEVAFDYRDRLDPGESVITRDGVWLGPDWLRVVPHKDDGAGIIERKQILENLNHRLEQSSLEVGKLHSELSKSKRRAEILVQEREDLQKQVNSLNVDLAEMRTHHGVRQVQIEEAGVRADRIRHESKEIGAQIEEETMRLAIARDALAAAELVRKNKADEGLQISKMRDAAEINLDRARQDSRDARDKYHSLNAKLETLRSQLLAIETARSRLTKQRSDLQEQINAVTAGIENSSVPLPQLKTELEEKLGARLGTETKISDIRNELDLVDEQIRRLESDRAESESRLEKVRSNLEETRLDGRGLSVEERNVKEMIGTTGFSFEEIEGTLPETAKEEVWVEELEKLDRKINRLGPINLAAIDEYESQSQRKTYLDQQNDDLVEALETLLSAIRKIDKETRARFRTTFDTVNKNLGELFPKVFGGGTAHLELTGEDLLDTGVTLMARPPGKRNSSIHLLSGGEKAMTAVALVFAIFRINPSPVCLLDEVDAPLDDSNVMRFADLIKEMSSDVQFLIITHNKLTMEMADHLMGVTMNEPGVSRLVSVDVEAAAAMAS